jgi:hypothetical protein
MLTSPFSKNKFHDKINPLYFGESLLLHFGHVFGVVLSIFKIMAPVSILHASSQFFKEKPCKFNRLLQICSVEDFSFFTPLGVVILRIFNVEILSTFFLFFFQNPLYFGESLFSLEPR